jgi:TolB-like protein/tetratricopeptide (TPR) repeat protein
MGNFLSELRRRHIYRIGAGYVVVAWGIAQVIDLLSQIFALPDWIAQPAVVMLAIGFPVTLIVAWLIEGKAHKGETGPVSPATRLDWLIAGGLAAVLSVIGYQQFAPEPAVVAAVVEEVEEVSDRLPNSIAVLPFQNLSVDPENAFFAAGIHDTLLNELAKISDMNVISRTSVLRYEDAQTPISQIAAELNVETVMEGTVQYADGEVRITAQLIDPETGAHLWSENYDRDFSGIFEIQTEIATNIAMALEAELLPAELESIEAPPTNSPDAFAAFLKAAAVIGGGIDVSASPNTRSTVQVYLDEALELDPDFALAHAWKVYIYLWSRLYDPVTEEDWPNFQIELDRLIDLHVNTALALDPGLGLAHAVRAQTHFYNWNARLAQLEADQALQLSPNSLWVLMISSEIETYVRERPELAVGHMERAIELNPNSAGAFDQMARALHQAGRYEEAIEAAQQCLTLDPRILICSLYMARSEFGLGNHEAALDALRVTEQLTLNDAAPEIQSILAWGYGLLGQAEDAQRTFEKFRVLAADRHVNAVAWVWAYMGVGDYDEALRLLNGIAENLELLREPYQAHLTRQNVWSDPMLEEPEWVEAREKLAVR